MMGVYTIWMCCGEFDQFDTKQECMSSAVGMMNSDNVHVILAIEGPNGEDLLPEAEELDISANQSWAKERESMPKPIGEIRISGPEGMGEGVEVVYSEKDKERLMEKYTADYEAQRVKWVSR